MGLIKALSSGVSSSLGDQFKEFVVCPTIESNVLIQRGEVRHGEGNSNPTEGVITNGSKINVPQGMAMMLIENGAIKEFSAEPGEYIWDAGSESSVFTGGFFKGIADTFKNIGKRFSYGGQVPTDQRVYYVNMLAITGNKFGSPQPKKITDDKYGMLEVTFFGTYAFQVQDPIILVQNVIGANPKDTITYEEILQDQLKSKFVEQITQAITIVMRKHKVPFGDMGMYGGDISNEMNVILDESWRKNYGLVVTDVSLSDINLTDESMERVSRIDDANIFSNPAMQSGLLAQSTAKAMETAAGNANGAMVGFMGMNMANQAGNSVLGAVNQNVGQAPQAAPVQTPPEPGTLFKHEEAATPAQEQPTQPTEELEPQTGVSFCPNCGTKSAGGNFCINCGTKLN